MKISYAILTHNEGQYIETLLSFLTTNKRPEDEIVIVDDFSTDLETIEILKKYVIFLYILYPDITISDIVTIYKNKYISSKFLLKSYTGSIT
jgi:glycosyltransferase involved in cell wall biosynthesis